MAMDFKSDEYGAGSHPPRTNKGRVLTLIALLVLSVLLLAWFDGGEEQLHSITHTVDVPQVQS